MRKEAEILREWVQMLVDYEVRPEIQTHELVKEMDALYQQASLARMFEKSNPTQQLCMVAQEIAKDEVRDVEP